MKRHASPILNIMMLSMLTALLSISQCSDLKMVRHVLSGRYLANRYFDSAPYYYGETDPIPDRTGHLPITAGRMPKVLTGSMKFFDRSALVQPLTEALNTYINELNITRPLSGFELTEDDTPAVHVGNSSEHPFEDQDDEDTAFSNTMMIVVRKPSDAWKAMLKDAAAAADVDYVLHITVGFSEYLYQKKALFSRKEVYDLGTGNQIPKKWYHNDDTPVEVLHLTGALMDTEGTIIRSGAEGIVAQKQGFWDIHSLSPLDRNDRLEKSELQRVLTEEMREDLPDRPLCWKVALQNLAAQLLNRQELIIQ